MPNRTRCEKHEGVEVYFTNRKCPVCLRDERISLLDLKVRFASSFIHWSSDYLKIVSYNGPDKPEREATINSVCAELERPEWDLKKVVEMLEEYKKTCIVFMVDSEVSC